MKLRLEGAIEALKQVADDCRKDAKSGQTEYEYLAIRAERIERIIEIIKKETTR